MSPFFLYLYNQLDQLSGAAPIQSKPYSMPSSLYATVNYPVH